MVGRENMHLLSKKREHWEIREKGIFLKSNFIIMLGFGFLFVHLFASETTGISITQVIHARLEGSKSPTCKTAAFSILFKGSSDSIRNKYTQIFSGFFRINLRNHAPIYSFIGSTFIEPCYVKVTELGIE